MTDLLSRLEWAHDDLADDLACHIGRSNRLTFTDMQLGPSGSPRPDVYSLPTTYSRFCPIAYECKVSVSDFRADVTAGKWQTYLPFASAVVFATPAGLISAKELPPGCGLMARGPNGWRMVKSPTLRPVENLPLAVWQKLLFDGIERAERFRKAEPRKAHDWLVRDRIARELGADVAALFTHREAIGKAASEIAGLMGSAQGASFAGAADRETRWHASNLSHAVSNVVGVWRDLAKLLGLESDWPSYRDLKEVKDRLARLDPRTASAAAIEALDRIRHQLDRTRRELAGADEETEGRRDADFL
ncbi:MmcB family DNA repair protein [Azospirillum sp. Sh1]|uniref:MmcB family DNA repair protein n=1 Tax=Azospirillum sp. Sh1 TaxID=2607285 RepID=UPI0011EC2C44|nr:MmcB family DNA repair protein [Azospirillum sp. Sh1]KAA0571112.1 hypothetical protein FZ029_28065 [Azospirillum sp. Sh1]